MKKYFFIVTLLIFILELLIFFIPSISLKIKFNGYDLRTDNPSILSSNLKGGYKRDYYLDWTFSALFSLENDSPFILNLNISDLGYDFIIKHNEHLVTTNILFCTDSFENGDIVIFGLNPFYNLKNNDSESILKEYETSSLKLNPEIFIQKNGIIRNKLSAGEELEINLSFRDIFQNRQIQILRASKSI